MIRRDRPLERLVDANPSFVDTSATNTKDPNRKGIGVAFDCPIHEDCRLYVPFAQPLDGGPQFDVKGWRRSGETFETLTLSPSVRMLGGEDGCRWHGFIRNGGFENCGDAR